MHAMTQNNNNRAKIPFDMGQTQQWKGTNFLQIRRKRERRKGEKIFLFFFPFFACLPNYDSAEAFWERKRFFFWRRITRRKETKSDFLALLWTEGEERRTRKKKKKNLFVLQIPLKRVGFQPDDKGSCDLK